MAEAHPSCCAKPAGTRRRQGGPRPGGRAAHLGALKGATGTSSCSSRTSRSASGPSTTCGPPTTRTVTASFDLLWKGLEVTTGAQREHRYDVLLKQAAEKGMGPEPLHDYLNCFRYGCPPHGGLGMGLGRVLMVLLGLDSHPRGHVPVPRTEPARPLT